MEKSLNILIIDDDEVDRMAVRRSLKIAGFDIEITEAWDCKSAIAILQQQYFDCVFIDYRLPDGDGLTLVQKIRENGVKAPLIILTGQGDEQTAVDLMKAGASDYISKTKVSPEVISRSLHNALRLYYAEQEAQKANQQLKESQERYRLVLEGSNDCIWDWDIRTNQIYWNDRFYEIIGLPKDGKPQTYDDFLKLLHPEDSQLAKSKLQAHLESNEEYNVELRIYNTSGEYRYCIARGKAQRDANGKPLRMAGIISDITNRVRIEAQQRFLADASTLLAVSLDYEKTLSNLAKLVVPHLADLCFVDIVEADGKLRRIAAVHTNPISEDLLAQISAWTLVDPSHQNHPIKQVLQTGVAKFSSNIDDLAKVESHNSQIQIRPNLRFKSYMIVPMLVQERITGTISFVLTRSGRCYGEDDLALAQDLGRRAALSMENAKAHREAKEASDNLRKAIIILGEQQQQLRILQHLTNLLNERLTDLPGLLRVMVQAVCDAIPGAGFCFIILHNPQCNGMLLTVTAGEGMENFRVEDNFSAGEGSLSQVFSPDKPPMFNSNKASKRTSPVLSAEALELFTSKSKVKEGLTNKTLNNQKPASLYAVGIESPQGGRLGLLAIGNWKDPTAFDDEDRHLLAAVGEQAAIAINNARLINTLEEREERLGSQYEMLAQQNRELESLSMRIHLQNQELLEAARLKSEFLSTMSHELRTPMNAVIGFSQLLLRQRQSNLNPHQADMVERILNNGKHLLRLINDILDLSKIESGRLQLKTEQFNLAQLIRSTTEEIRCLATQKSLMLHVDINLDNPYIVNDSSRMRQILINLLSNAIKFTDSGAVWVSVWEESPDQIALTVKDTGIGIAQDQLKHIFEQFRQVDQSIRRKYEGTGLGLAITESLVQMMNGKISVESNLGEGSTFRFDFPRKLSD